MIAWLALGRSPKTRACRTRPLLSQVRRAAGLGLLRPASAGIFGSKTEVVHLNAYEQRRSKKTPSRSSPRRTTSEHRFAERLRLCTGVTKGLLRWYVTVQTVGKNVSGGMSVQVSMLPVEDRAKDDAASALIFQVSCGCTQVHECLGPGCCPCHVSTMEPMAFASVFSD